MPIIHPLIFLSITNVMFVCLFVCLLSCRTALEQTTLYVGPGLTPGWRLTELRLWAEVRSAVQLEVSRLVDCLDVLVYTVGGIVMLVGNSPYIR